jgi:hypothetical protein
MAARSSPLSVSNSAMEEIVIAVLIQVLVLLLEAAVLHLLRRPRRVLPI